MEDFSQKSDGDRAALMLSLACKNYLFYLSLRLCGQLRFVTIDISILYITQFFYPQTSFLHYSLAQVPTYQCMYVCYIERSLVCENHSFCYFALGVTLEFDVTFRISLTKHINSI